MDNSRPLWAPWRIEFIRGEKDDRCFLCGKREVFDSPEEDMIVARGQTMFVILNRYPYNSGHLMVVPYRHIGDIADMERDEQIELMELTVKARLVLGGLMCPQGFNVGFNLGLAAGAGVAEHIHLHIVPRWNGDTNFMPVLGSCRVVPEALHETAELIRNAWE